MPAHSLPKQWIISWESTSMTNLNHSHKPLEPLHVNVRHCIGFRQDSSQLQAYSCTLQKWTSGRLRRRSIGCVCMYVFVFRLDMKTWLTSDCVHTGEYSFHIYLLFVQLYSLRTQPFVHTNAISFQKQIQERGKNTHGRMNISVLFVELPVKTLLIDV
jgi:hypothetical protein